MQSRSSSTMQPRARWPAVAELGQLHWFFGNVYKGVVYMPQLLAVLVAAFCRSRTGSLISASPSPHDSPVNIVLAVLSVHGGAVLLAGGKR
jgi:hypothetical protein